MNPSSPSFPIASSEPGTAGGHGLALLDYAIILLSLAIIFFVAIWLAKKAARGLESYFLGGRSLPWYLLGVSGMSAWFDLTGTMIITSFLFLMGPSGLFIEFRGGAVLILAFMMAFTAKWNRRSGCMTLAEWQTYRFGTSASAETLRALIAAVGVITSVGWMAYVVRGATLFMGMVFPFDPVVVTLAVLGLAAVYTIFAGFLGVVLSDFVMGALMIVTCMAVALVAWGAFPDAEAIRSAALAATGNERWLSSAPAWRQDMPAGYGAYEFVIMAALFYLARHTLGGLASGADPHIYGAKNPREASLQCLVQGLTIMFRWPMMIGMALLGLLVVVESFPDQGMIVRARDAIAKAHPDLTAATWHNQTAAMAQGRVPVPDGLRQELESALGPDWRNALFLVGHAGAVNPEMVVPAVVMKSFPPGLRGLVVAALLAALMSTLAVMVNRAGALFVRDIYQNFLRPKAGNRELILVSYGTSALVVALSMWMGLAADNINSLWGWIIMGLSAGALGPGLCRMFWWRTTAWGCAIGLLSGNLAAVVQRLVFPGLVEWWQFPLMTGVSLLGTILGSVLTRPADRETLTQFYRTTRPFGFWGHLHAELPADERAALRREHRNDILSCAIILVWQVLLFMIPMQILTRNFGAVAITGPVFVAACVAIYFVWYRNLPRPDEEVADFAGKPPVH